MKKIINVVGARPNFMKIHQLQLELDQYSNAVIYKLVHTGQHYDANMSQNFFDDLGMKKPDYFLNVGSGGHGEQTGRIMIEFEKILLSEKPDIVVVAGDVNSTIACALDAVKLGIKVAHIEAGCRSFDRKMPEEINRVLTDAISDYLFTLDETGNQNLINEGIPRNKIFCVGDIMIDAVDYILKKNTESFIKTKFNLKKNDYAVVTLHRPSNVDNIENLSLIVDILKAVQQKTKLVFPIHPRTLKNLKSFSKKNKKLSELFEIENIFLTEPLDYSNFINLIKDSKFVLTDSGSIQIETSYMNIPCLTMRDTTERRCTIDFGTNELVSLNKDLILKFVTDILNGKYKTAKNNDNWRNKVSERIVKILLNGEK
ncbi:MAG TPA: UDP-N-acetylglucosamine 2-epimerase (non-hydrolyzing) [bacterium]|nr:UDP-N-acetylglucosamine 2-epimerase (non-hydrolyzing) [bacterium]